VSARPQRVEDWHWPPQYDSNYRPPLDQLHWFPARETQEPAVRDAAILVRINELMRYAAQKSSFYRVKWASAGVDVGHLRSLEEFERVPTVTKEELRADQAEHPPFGSYLCVPEAEVKHVNGTSGTTGRPTAFGICQRDWNSIANAHARVMWAMGIRPSDVVLIGSPLSLYMGSWGAYIGAERLGSRVFPFGAGAAGQSARTVRWMQQMSVTVFYGTPSYALRLAEAAQAEGIDPGKLGLRTMFFSGEPGASVPAIRRLIADQFKASIYDSGSMAEVSPWMHLGADSDAPGLLCWQDLVYAEVCDPATMRRVQWGQEGTPIYTTLERVSQPMIRLVSNDLTRWEAPAADALRSYPRLPRGIYGRIDDMFVVRGENIYPSAIDDIVMADPSYGGEHRIIVSREQTMDSLTVQVEFADGASPATAAEWAKRLAGRLRTVLGVGTIVQPVPSRTFERTDFKARRVIDDRALHHTVRRSDTDD
jgi:phenylacetate-CoA ligase